jgi:rare lipoprotein A
MRAEGVGRRATALWPAVAAALLAGCAGPAKEIIGGDTDSAPVRPRDVTQIPDPVPRAEPRSSRGNPPFYEVMGKRYYVMNDAGNYRELGVASWYGTKFHGRLTSSGEPYDMYAMTAAHKTLPLPTYVRVTHRGNGRSIIVRVNDRGPFVGERIIDLSYAAAVRLGMHNEGTALVDVEVVTPATGGTAPASGAASLASATAPDQHVQAVWLQVGAFSDETNAARMQSRLAGEGVKDVVTSPEHRGRQTIYRVRVGPLGAIEEIEAMLARVRALGIADAHLTMD